MPYNSTGLVVHDADAHIMETPNWLRDHADPAVRERIHALTYASINELRQTGDPREQLRDLDSTFEGYVEEFPPGPGGAFSNNPRTIARLSHAIVAKALPYPIAPFYVVLGADRVVITDTKTRQPTRIGAPDLNDGPHQSYALQWFSFALIALVGAGIVVKQSRSSGTRPTSGADV